MTILKSFFALSSLLGLCLTTLPSQAAKRFSLYLPNNDFCAVYNGRIHNEYKFVLWVNQEDQLTIEANDYLEVAVSHQGNVITPYQVDSDHQPMSSQWFYQTKMQQKHTILVKGNTPRANIRFCLRDK
ncbi:hypothetical protein [Crocosphaera sp.]|uniref:hypothetical protein n=1 Tax=Crocosphaera sp. TaxID=2729996 RepID=UPI002631C6D0|nr:hypothetical protein [Crocosphaera sp.]MDJ0582170.1 hypothetical protein [Crocosphaera sp.]